MAEKAKAEKPSFEIYAANPLYSGVHPCRLRFEDGVGRTADERQAQHCRDAGLAVFDVNDEGDAKAAKAYAKLLRNPELSDAERSEAIAAFLDARRADQQKAAAAAAAAAKK